MLAKIKRLGILVTMGVVVCSLMVGCTKKTPVTHEQIRTELENRGYTVEVDTSEELVATGATSLVEATKEGYIVEYISFADTNDAVEYFAGFKKEYDENTDKFTTRSSVTTNTYEKIDCVYEGEYTCIARVENTMVYLNTEDGKQEELKTFLKDIGY